MLRQLLTIADRYIAHLPGWMMLLGGAVLLSAAALAPAWLEARELAWQRDIMKLQHERLIEQEAGYARFREALANDDPAVLTRLAFVHLRQKPVGADPLGVVAFNDAGDYALQFVSDPNDPETCYRLVRDCLDHPTAGNVDAWLYRPMPQVGVDYAPLPPVRGRIVRLATGPMRVPLAAAGLLCIAVGLVPPTMSEA